MSVLIGIDPGITGAIVVLKDGAPEQWWRMPVVVHGKSKRVDGGMIAQRLGMFVPVIDSVYIEDVHSMPKQGVASSFSFGCSLGVVLGVVEALQLPYAYVTPQAWKKCAGLIGADKDASRSLARQLWPKWSALEHKLEGQAMADAALISLCG